MSSVRQAAVAGRFYPGDPGELRRLVESLLASASPATGPAPKAVIVPHAGYIFSGPIAASAYARLAPARAEIKRIVLLGPAHYEDFAGLALSSAGWFATPLGQVPLDAEAARALAGLKQVKVLDAAHEREHSLEVQLPFLQVVLDGFRLVPLAVGETGAEAVGEVLEALWGGPETRVVISSDLSHYYDAETAHSLDRMTADAIEALKAEDLGDEQACGVLPIQGLLQIAQRHGLRGRTLDLRNSNDTGGPRERVVGYGAFAFG